MMQPNQIGQLLTAGAAPSEEESAHLAELGSFAAAMYTRYLHGMQRPPLERARAMDWAAHMSHRLSASTATRWTEPLGALHGMLDGAWSGFWQILESGLTPGYYSLDAGRGPVVELYEDEPSAPAVRTRRRAARRRGSLFGPRTRRPSRRGKRRAAAGARSELLRWADGGTVSPAVVEAVESGGLYLDDQIESYEPIELFDDAMLGPQASATVGSPVSTPALGAARPTSVFLDGLRIDDRTPALAAAISTAHGAFGGARKPGLGRSAGQLSASDMVSVDLDRVAPPTPERRPVFAFFDAVEGDFLGLGPEVVEGFSRPSQQPVVRPAPAAPPPPIPAAQAAPARASQPQRPPVGPPRTSLDQIVPVVSPTSARNVVASAPPVRPYTAGVFTPPPSPRPSAAPPTLAAAERFAVELVHDRAGRARPRVHRSAVASPRVALEHRPLMMMSSGAPGTVAPSQFAEPWSPPTEAIVAAGEIQPGQPTELPAPIGIADAAAPVQPRRGDPARTFSTVTGFEPDSAERFGSPTLSWRLASDLGPELPLGASLTRTETLAGAIAGRGRLDDVQVADTFRPLMAGGPQAASTVHRGGAPEALDGVAWVALHVDAAQPEDRRLPLATVPSGRRTAMVPAARALELVAAQAAARSARPAPRKDAVASPARSPWTPAATRAEAVAAAVLADVAVPAAAKAPAEERPAATVPPVMAPSAMVPTTEAASAMAPPAMVPTTEAPSAMVPTTEAPASLTRLVAQADAAVVAPFVVSAAAWEPRTTRVMPSLATDQAVSTVLASPVTVGEQPSVAGFDPTVASILSGAPTLAKTPRFGYAAFSGVKRGASLVGLGRRAPATKRRARARAVGTRAATAFVSQASEAPAAVTGAQVRAALRRPVVTARETMTVAPFFASDGPIAQGATASAEARSEVLPQLVQRLDERRVQRHEVTGTTAPWTPPDAVEAVARLARLAPPERAQIAAGLRSSGWTEPELRMLQLATEPASASKPTSDPRLASKPTSEPRLAGKPTSEPFAVDAPTVDFRRAVSVARNLARVLTGSETLAAGTAGARQPTVAGAEVAAVTLPTAMPMLQRSEDQYFGSLAPQRGHAAHYGGLTEAVRELLSLAHGRRTASVDGPTLELASAATSEMVPRSTRQQLIQQLERLERVAVAAQPSASVATVAEAAEAFQAGADVTAQAPRIQTQAALPERVEARARAESVPGYYPETPTEVVSLRQVPAALEERIATSLGLSVRGPAGVDRLLAPLAEPRVGQTAAVTPALMVPQRAPDLAARSAAAERAELISQPLDLEGVAAPEAMLGGMAAPTLRGAFASKLAAAGGPGELAVLTRMAPSADEVSVTAVDEWQPGMTPAAPGRAPEAASASRGAVSEGSPVARLARTLAKRGVEPARVSKAVAGAPVTQQLVGLVDAVGGRSAQQAGLTPRAIGQMLRRLRSKERVSVLAGTDGADFALAWAKRVDGSRTGLDLGLGETSMEMARFYGPEATRHSVVAAQSPMPDAGYVAVGKARPEPRHEDASGVRQVMRAAAHSSPGARGAQVSAAARGIDWGEVHTGSAEPTGAADLGRMAASTIAAHGVTPSRVPLPLVAPAVKAVAQTALHARTSTPTTVEPAGATSTDMDSAGASSGDGTRQGEAMSPEAMKNLVNEMMPFVMRAMLRDKERRGIWG